jgi:hypothetical protein
MKEGKVNRSGSGAAAAVIAVSVVIYVILPLFTAIIQKAIIYHETARIKDVIEFSVMSLATCNDTLSFSGKELTFDTDEYDLRGIVYDQVSAQLKDIVDLKKEDIAAVVCAKGVQCACGYMSAHIMIYVDIDAILQFPGIYSSSHAFSVHTHVELPVIQ